MDERGFREEVCYSAILMREKERNFFVFVCVFLVHAIFAWLCFCREGWFLRFARGKVIKRGMRWTSEII